MKLLLFLSKLFGGSQNTSQSHQIIYALPDIRVFKKCYNRDAFFHDIDRSDWGAVIDGFHARFEKWYFANMNGGHSSYLDMCALCALVEVFCHYEFEKAWHEPKNYKEFLRKLDPVFRRQLGAPISVTRNEGGRWTAGKLKDFADVFYTGVRCSLHHHGDLASFAGMSGTGQLAIEKPSAGQSLCGNHQFSIVIFDPGCLKASLERWIREYCDELRASPTGQKATRFRDRFENDFGIQLL